MRRAILFAAGAGLVFFAVDACVGDDPDSTPTGGENDGGGFVSDAGVSETGVPNLAPDAAPPANCPLDCLPPAPQGWSGPNAVYDGPPNAKPADCPPLYTQKKVESGADLASPPATCGCNSPTFAGASCTSQVLFYAGTDCNGGAGLEGTVTSPGTFCHEVQSGTGRMKVSTPTLTAGTCAFPDAGVVTLPPTAFAKVQVSCGLPVNASCKDRSDCVGSPIPASPYTRLCIHQDGDVPCPSADYAARFLAHKNVDDKRGCTGCTGAAAGSCGDKYGVVGNQNICLTGAPPSTSTAGACFAQSIGQWINGSNLAPTGMTCQPDGGVPNGSATPIEPITFCCNN